MRTRPRVLLDIDGVCADFITRALKHLEPIRPGLSHDDITAYRMEIPIGLTEAQTALWHQAVCERGYCASIPTYAGAKEGVARLKELGDVHPVTFPFPGSPWWILERETWLQEHLGIDPGMAVYTKTKHVIAGDIFIEDTTSYLVEWRKHNPDGAAFRMRRAYNAHEPFTHGITVGDWSELVREVETVLDLRERQRRAVYDD